MTGTHLHIVAFDVPYPADYGGVIDVYYKIKALHELGVKITLHTFLYRRKPAPELENICHTVFYYPRKTGIRYNLQSVPYIVASRKVPALLQNLLADEYPVLLEGLHCCSYLPELRKAGKKVWVRTHNIEHEYYRWLGETEKKNHRKLFFRTEASKLKAYEKQLAAADGIAAISAQDSVHFRKINNETVFVPAFHGLDGNSPLPGKGDYALYHGNLEISDNTAAVDFLVSEVFRDNIFPLVIAGKNPPATLKKQWTSQPGITVVENPGEEGLKALLQNAQMHVLPAQGNAGMKLKLLNALYLGRFVIANQAMTGELPPGFCTMAETPAEWKTQVQEQKEKEFSGEMRAHRQQLLEENFSDAASAKRLYQMIYGNLPLSR